MHTWPLNNLFPPFNNTSWWNACAVSKSDLDKININNDLFFQKLEKIGSFQNLIIGSVKSDVLKTSWPHQSWQLVGSSIVSFLCLWSGITGIKRKEGRQKKKRKWEFGLYSFVVFSTVSHIISRAVKIHQLFWFLFFSFSFFSFFSFGSCQSKLESKNSKSKLFSSKLVFCRYGRWYRNLSKGIWWSD